MRPPAADSNPLSVRWASGKQENPMNNDPKSHDELVAEVLRLQKRVNRRTTLSAVLAIIAIALSVAFSLAGTK